MALKIRVYSDYVCPYCFLVGKPLQEAVRGKDVEVEWMPFELRPYPAETLLREGDYLQTTWAQSVYPMAKGMDIPIVLPKVSPQPHTRLAFEGYQYAREQGKGNDYNDRMLRAFFQEEQDIGRLDVLTRLAGEIGLDEEEFCRALEAGTYREAHQRALHHAYHEARITAVPTFYIGERVVRGIPSRELLERVVNEELARQGGDS